MNDDGRDPDALWRFSVTLLTIGYIVFLLRDVLVPFAVAFILAYIFTPVVNWLERRLRLPRCLAVLLLLCILVLPIAAILWLNGPLLAQSALKQADNIPELLTRFLTNLFDGQQFSVLGHHFDVRIVVPYLMDRLQDLLGAPLGVAQVAWSFVNVIMGAIFTFVVFVYFLAGGKGLISGALRMAPIAQRENLSNLVNKIDALIGSYLRGLAIIVVFTALVVWIAFKFVFDIPYAEFFALVIGLLEIIPLFGPIVSGTLTGIVALAQGNMLFFAKVMAFYLVVRFTNDQVVSPIVLGKAVTLSPVVILFAFLSGGSLFGFLGLLFAVPVAAIFKVILDEQVSV